MNNSGAEDLNTKHYEMVSHLIIERILIYVQTYDFQFLFFYSLL
jgi:hypothetical protein